MTTTLTENVLRRTAACVVSLANGYRSLDNITVASGQNLSANAVVGRISKGIGRANVPAVVGTGNGTMSLVVPGPDVEAGSYVVKNKTAVTNGGVFSVTTPSGELLPDLTLTVGAGATTAYTAGSNHIAFSITDGSADFALNDTFTIVVGTTAPTVVGTGNGTITAVAGPQAQAGTYTVINRQTITNGGRFEIIAPDGESLGDNFTLTASNGSVTTFTTPQITVTITEGSTDFVAGDYFNVAVFNAISPAGGPIVEWDRTPTAQDGRQTVAGILWSSVDATSAATDGVIISRHAEINEKELVWPTGTTVAEKSEGMRQLAELGIIHRPSMD